MNKVALIIPTYEPHYKYNYNLLQNIINNKINIDLFLVFTSEEDLNLFHFYKDRFTPIILQENYKTGNIITFKKLYALDLLKHSQYEYIIVIDSEVDLIIDSCNKYGIYNKLDELWNNKKLFGVGFEKSKTHNMYKINGASLSVFKDKISNNSDDLYIYCWWGELPFYRRDTLTDFFNKIDYTNLIWEHFDHIIYQRYLINYHSFEVLDVKHIVGNNIQTLESFISNDNSKFDALDKIGYKFSCCNLDNYKKNKAYLINKGCILVYHIDRFDNTYIYT
jgi:hypothetical protein